MRARVRVTPSQPSPLFLVYDSFFPLISPPLRDVMSFLLASLKSMTGKHSSVSLCERVHYSREISYFYFFFYFFYF